MVLLVHLVQLVLVDSLELLVVQVVLEVQAYLVTAGLGVSEEMMEQTALLVPMVIQVSKDPLGLLEKEDWWDVLVSVVRTEQGGPKEHQVLVEQLDSLEHQGITVSPVQMVLKGLPVQKGREEIHHRLVYQDLVVQLDLKEILEQLENLEIKGYREHRGLLVALAS